MNRGRAPENAATVLLILPGCLLTCRNELRYAWADTVAGSTIVNVTIVEPGAVPGLQGLRKGRQERPEGRVIRQCSTARRCRSGCARGA